jgi:hypothetical protein
MVDFECRRPWVVQADLEKNEYLQVSTLALVTHTLSGLLNWEKGSLRTLTSYQMGSRRPKGRAGLKMQNVEVCPETSGHYFLPG